jgi:hypothetical protein
VSIPSLSEREWDLCLLPAGEATPELDPGGSQALTGVAVAVHERAYKQLLADLPADEAGRAEFLSAFGSLDRYLARNIADGTFTALMTVPDTPGSDQPVRAAEIEVVELADGLMVRQAEPPRVHQLNNTAAIVLESCDGERTVAEIAEVLAEAFGFETPPLAEAAACVEELRRAGVLADRAHHPTKACLVTAELTHQINESRS